ncbi:hypothetical protein [Dactylosporangium sp. NPDC051541]|uniref:hypothetical protein n=1 Tax=Dactylosporangium sp. NPDC051541 TaxID=3363977 RepID=UPI0037A6AE1D
MRGLSIVISAVVVVSLSLAAVLAVWHEVMTRVVGIEAYKNLLQFCLVVVLGGAVSLLYQAYNRQVDRQAEVKRQDEHRADAVQETRQRYLSELIGHYNRVKRARRLLRAKALTHDPDRANRRVRVARYDELLQSVLDAQLTFETMSRTMRVEGSLFATDHDLIAALIRAESYLRALVTEYENVMPQADRAEVELRMLPELADFVGPYEESKRFRTEFVHSTQAALAALEHLIVDAAQPDTLRSVDGPPSTSPK